MTVTTNPPTLDHEYNLTPETAEFYRENGHAFVPNLASPEEIAFYREAINSAADRFGQAPDTPLASRDTYGKAFLQHKNLWEFDETVAAFTLSPRFGRVAADLMGASGVRLYHDQALFKEPGGGFTPWHQDHYYWPIDTDHTITMWMPLVDITEEMGMLTFASRSHRSGYLGTLPISDESEQIFQNYVDEQGYSIHRQPSMKAGDATFHSGWCLHSAPGNSSQTMREVMTVIWVASEARVSEPVNENQSKDLARWLPGLKPGDPAASRLNPLIF